MKKFFVGMLACLMLFAFVSCEMGAPEPKSATVKNLEEMKAALKDATIKKIILSEDLTGDVGINRSVIIDLNGKTLTGGVDGKTIWVCGDADNHVENDITLTIKNGTLVGGYAFHVFKLDKNVAATLDKVTVKYSGNSNAVSANGSGPGDVSITVKNCIIDNIDENLGENEPVGIYLSGDKNINVRKLTVENSSVEGATAIEVKHTDAVINKSTLIPLAPKPTKYTANGNGSCSTGFKLALTKNSSDTAEEIRGSLTVDGKKITATSDEDLYFVIEE